MLVLTCRHKEKIYITHEGVSTEIVVLGTSIGDGVNHDTAQIRLGFAAPREVIIDREKIHKARLANPDYAPRHASASC